MQGAVCVTSRAMMLSGRSLFRINDKLEGIPTWPAFFARMGYRTFMTGKWHNTPPSALASFSAGKSIFFGGMGDPFTLPVADITSQHKLTDKKPSGKHSCELFADSRDRFHQTAEGEPSSRSSLTSPSTARTIPVRRRRSITRSTTRTSRRCRRTFCRCIRLTAAPTSPAATSAWPRHAHAGACPPASRRLLCVYHLPRRPGWPHSRRTEGRRPGRRHDHRLR